jgi:hypothetical protein
VADKGGIGNPAIHPRRRPRSCNRVGSESIEDQPSRKRFGAAGEDENEDDFNCCNPACGRAGNGYIAFMLPDEQTSPEQFAIFRRMTPERRLALAESLFWTAREMKKSWLRAQHADWSEEQIARETTRIFRHART